MNPQKMPAITPSKQIAKILFDVKAVQLNTEVFYKYVSGILSPIYVDNRRTISFPEPRKLIVNEFASLIKDNLGAGAEDIIGGVATGGVPWASWVAHALDLPLIYVRPAAKDRGLNKQVEGVLAEGQRVILVEDLITTGLSSLNAVETIRSLGGVVDVVASIFSYGSPASAIRFEKAKVQKAPLTNLECALQVARESNLLNEAQLQIVRDWMDTVLATWGMEGL